MADYGYAFFGCDCLDTGNGHQLLCAQARNHEDNLKLYQQGYRGYERKIHCGTCGSFVAETDAHTRWHKHLLDIADDARWGGMSRPLA
jgi:hypothetical protein